jgi:MoaA/NifB/PqqE/SkfB family radical SAM enzyme
MSKSLWAIKIVEAKDANAKISPTFCLAKWKNVSMNLTAGWTHSCYHPPEHKIPLDELKENHTALHNTKQKKAERAKMMNGERPDGCSYCWKIEDLPGEQVSDRVHRTADVMTETSHAEIVQNPDPANFDVTPSYVEVNFSSVCNFKCSYCSPHLSNSWQKEIEKFGPYPTTVPHNSIDYFKKVGWMPIANKDGNPYVEAFWKWWPDLYPQLRYFRMTGGEPLMDVNTYKVFDYVKANPKPDLQLAITSNFCPDPKLMKKFNTQIKEILDTPNSLFHFMVFISVDAYGKKAEYIRHGMDFEYLRTNIDEFLQNNPNKAGITYIMTMNCMSITSLRQLIDEFVIKMQEKHVKDWQKIWFDTPILHYPNWQSVQLLPPRYRDILRADIEYFKTKLADDFVNNAYVGIKDFQIQRLERLLAWMEEGDKLPAEKVQRDRADFYKFFTEHDERRNTNFLETFPEMQDFWELCEDAAFNLE